MKCVLGTYRLRLNETTWSTDESGVRRDCGTNDELISYRRLASHAALTPHRVVLSLSRSSSSLYHVSLIFIFIHMSLLYTPAAAAAGGNRDTQALRE